MQNALQFVSYYIDRIMLMITEIINNSITSGHVLFQMCFGYNPVKRTQPLIKISLITTDQKIPENVLDQLLLNDHLRYHK